MIEQIPIVEILVRLMGDQEKESKHPYRGQFAKTRRDSERVTYQRDTQPLGEKPQVYMTFTAVHALLCLKQMIKASKDKAFSATGLSQYCNAITDSINLAIRFSERLLLSHSDGLVREHFTFDEGEVEELITYRHTIGALIVLLLTERQQRLVMKVLKTLVEAEIQNPDCGWPMADRKFISSDILCSAHAAYLFGLAIESERFPSLERTLRHKLETTLAYLTIQSERGRGLWIYDDENSSVPITARTYPELFTLYKDRKSVLAYRIPERLLEWYPVPDVPITGVENSDQTLIRLAYVFKLASEVNIDMFLEKYIVARADALSAYSPEQYYSTYELSCLLIMSIDRFQETDSIDFATIHYIIEPILEKMPIYFFGTVYTVSKEVVQRLRETGLLRKPEPK